MAGSKIFCVLTALVIWTCFAGTLPCASAADWPMWRCDANRSAASLNELPAELHLHWVREYLPLKPAWEDPVNQDRMPFDRVYEPVVMGNRMFIGFNNTDKVVALDTRTGREVWKFYTDGPVRLPPAAWEQKVLFTSDDGCLYCLSAGSGKLVWKFRAGPSGRKILGNSRLISTWPARGGPVIKDGIVYFAASIWPFMGTFIHTIDIETGKVIWTNDGTGSTFMNQPHGGSVSFASVAPQGSFAAIGNKLIVPGGRSVPACLDRQTGELLYYHLSGSSYHQIGGGPGMKLEGGSHVSAIGKFFFNHRGINTTMYDTETGEAYIMWRTTTYPVLTNDVCYFSGNPVVAYDLKSLRKIPYDTKVKDRKTEKMKTVRKYRWEMVKLWECGVDGTGALIKAGNRLYAGGKNVVLALDVSQSGMPAVVWTANIKGTAARIIAADDRLFVVTLQGRIYAFGAGKKKVKTYKFAATEPPGKNFADEKKTIEILECTGVKTGYALLYGAGSHSLLESLVHNSQLRIIAVIPGAEKVGELRKHFDRTGLYGKRIAIHQGSPLTFNAPPYIASLTIVEELSAVGYQPGATLLKKIYHSMRPYGGIAYLPASAKAAIQHLLKDNQFPGAEISEQGGAVLLKRSGPLPGSGDWTHQYGNIANTAKSDDKLVRLPLGLLWFGGNSHHDVLPRHAHGPPEQVIGGRLFIEGINMLSARDVYTGEVLWKRTFPELGTFGVYYNETYKEDPLDTTYNQRHLPGANARGTNYVAALDKIYLLAGGDCLVLDSATGKTITTFSLPAESDAAEKPLWGYIGVYEDLLIAGSNFVRFSQQYKLAHPQNPFRNFDTTSSRKLVVMNRHTGKVRWMRDSKYGFRHNAIAVGAGKLFCIDSIPEPVLDLLRRRGQTPDSKPVLLALDVRTGERVWSTTENVFGTWLGYSKERDILIQSGRESGDMIVSEPTERIIAYRGGDGTVVWDKPINHGGPCMLHGDTIYFNAVSTEAAAVNLLTGEKKMRKHPLTGEQIPWRYHRRYGCNSVVASEHLLTFRSGAAGYYDLQHNGGTGNLGGFKSGCTSNLIAANGVLNAPDYTRTCTCSYQNQTSLALIYMPESEIWTFNQLEVEGKRPVRIRQVGINFGAPGDRMAENGTLWLDYPSVGGPSPQLRVVLEPMNNVMQKNGLLSPTPAFAGKRGGDAEAGEKKSPPRLLGEDKSGGGRIFRYHSSRIKSGKLKWVAASGLVDVTGVTVTLAEAATDERPYTVRLYFAEPDGLGPGQRIFNVAIQKKEILKNFDIVSEAGGINRCVVREFKGVAVKDVLDMALTGAAGKEAGPVLCGIEIIAEGW